MSGGRSLQRFSFCIHRFCYFFGGEDLHWLGLLFCWDFCFYTKLSCWNRVFVLEFGNWFFLYPKRILLILTLEFEILENCTKIPKLKFSNWPLLKLFFGSLLSGFNFCFNLILLVYFSQFCWLYDTSITGNRWLQCTP